MKKFKRLMTSILCSILIVSNLITPLEVQAAPGYHTEYHNGGAWTAWGETLAGCDNYAKDVKSNMCVHFLEWNIVTPYLEKKDTNGYYQYWVSESRKYGYDWNTVPTSLSDPRWEAAKNIIGYYGFPCDGGFACITTDNTIWYIKREWQFTSAYGDYQGVTFDKDAAEAESRALGYGEIWENEIDLRIFYTTPSTTCDSDKLYKVVREMGYYAWDSANNGGGGYDFITYSSNFSDSTRNKTTTVLRKDYDYTSDWYSRRGNQIFQHENPDNDPNVGVYFANKGALSIEKKLYYPELGYEEYPSYAVTMHNYTNKGVSGYDSSGNIIWNMDSNTGYELDGHTHSATRYRCLGHTVVNPYTVRYNSNGGTGTIADQKVKFEQTFNLSDGSGFSKADYHIIGWSLNKGTSNTVNYSLSQSVKNLTDVENGIVNLYAVWEPNGHILDLNGELDGVMYSNLNGFGTADISGTDSTGKAVASNDVTDFYSKLKNGSAYTVSDIKALKGYTYQGLSSDSAALNGNIYNTTNVRLKFTTNEYKVTLKAGTGVQSVRLVDSGLTEQYRKYKSIVPITATLKTGYSWAEGSGWTGTFNFDKQTHSFTMPYNDVVLTANAVANGYFVKYEKGLTNNGGSTATTSHVYDQDVTLAKNEFVGMSYKIKFDGNKPDTIGTVQNLPSTIVGNLDFNKWSVIASHNSGVYDANVNLGVKNFEHKQGATATATALWNNKLEGWGNPTLIGYNFAGWYYEDGTKVDTENDKFDRNNCLIVHPNKSQFEKTIKAYWTPRDDTKYTVNHWWQNVDAVSNEHNDKNYTLHETEILEWTSDEYVSPPVKDYEGFISPDRVRVRVQADGSTIVNYYYDRVRVSLDIDGEYMKIHYPDTNGLATFDMYINGKIVANDVREYTNHSILWGSKWEIKDINPDAGRHYSGVKTETDKEIIE